MTTYVFEPLDTLFFRDSQPFNSGEGGNNIVASLFPPNPPTLAGALRATFARGQGWTKGDWAPNIKAALGDRDKPKPLWFRGPYLLHNDKPLFPAPAHLVGTLLTNGWGDLTLLKPGAPLDCDLGRGVRLPAPCGARETLSGAWLDVAGMTDVLAGHVPTTGIITESTLWLEEPRTGIGRNFATRSVVIGMLYTARHARTQHKVSLALVVENAPAGWVPVTPALTGGESRMAWVTVGANSVALPQAPQLAATLSGALRYTATLITPALLPRDALLPGAAIPGLPGTVACACVDRPAKLGGWNTEAKQPAPLRALMRAGTTWFIEAGSGDAGTARAMHGAHIGADTEWGFGQILIGNWKE